MMANIGMADTLILMVLALVVFGPRRLPQIGRQIGKLMYEFRKASNDFKFQMEEELRQSEEADRRKKEEEERKRALAAAPHPPQIEQSATPAAESPITPAESSTHLSPSAESPYSAESAYVDQTYPEGAGESRDDSSYELTAATSSGSSPTAAAPEPTTPRILPPSTGEKVAADRPGTHAESIELAAGEPGKASESDTTDAERSEPAFPHAAHNAVHNATNNG